MEKRYLILIGELYIRDICVSEYNADTNFIRGIELHAEYGDTYTSASAIAIKKMLIELGISGDVITIEEVKESE